MTTGTKTAAPPAKTIADQAPPKQQLMAVEDARTLWDLEDCFTPKQLEHWAKLLRNWRGQDLPPKDDVLTFIWRCRATGLDPWLQQIVAIYRFDRKQNKQVMAVQTTVKGLLVCAHRSGLLVSVSNPTFSENEVTVTKKVGKGDADEDEPEGREM